MTCTQRSYQFIIEEDDTVTCWVWVDNDAVAYYNNLTWESFRRLVLLWLIKGSAITSPQEDDRFDYELIFTDTPVKHSTQSLLICGDMINTVGLAPKGEQDDNN